MAIEKPSAGSQDGFLISYTSQLRGLRLAYFEPEHWDAPTVKTDSSNSRPFPAKFLRAVARGGEYMQAKNERVLFLSVIEAAMEDAKETNVRVRQAALEWLMQDQADFPRICELAGLDSAYVRKNLASRLSSSPSVQSNRHHIVAKTTASLKVGVPDGIHP